MSTTMTHATPPAGVVLARQITFLWISRRPAFLITLMLISSVGAAALMGFFGESAGRVLLDVAPGILFISGLWGILVWRDEGPAKRSYFLSLPVDIAAHHILRIAAGAAWLLLALGVFLAAGLLVAAVTGAGAEMIRVLPLLLPHYVISSLILYFLVAAIATITNRPAEWLVLSYVGLMFVAVLAQLPALRPAANVLDTVLVGAWGFGTAVDAGLRGATDAVDSAVRLGPIYAAWLPAAALWLTIAVVAVVLAARSRHARP